MFLEQLDIINFRNYDKTSLNLSKNINIFYGNNAQGKTNILEAIYFLGFAKSYRTKNDYDLLKYNKRSFKVEAILNKNDIKSKYIIKYKDEKKYFIDQAEYKKISDYISNINIISFTPDDIEILKGLPDVRRKFIDDELGQLYNTYYKVNIEYKKILKMRNEILKKYNITNQIDLNYFNILTEYLIDKATFIYRARKKFIDKLNEFVAGIYKEIIGLDGFKIIYKSQLSDNIYTNDSIKKELKEKFEVNFIKEKDMGVTLFGPHRDDFEFFLANSNLKYYGSQGQQKLAVLTIKLAEILIFKKQTNYYPILLLDDIFSEFDKDRVNNILKYVNDEMQVIITTTNVKNVKKTLLNNSKLFYIEQGNVTEI